MGIHRRRFLQFAASGASLLAAPTVFAQGAYPNRPVLASWSAMRRAAEPTWRLG